MTFDKHLGILVALLSVFVVSGYSQQPNVEPAPTVNRQAVKYVLGPGDEFVISSDATEIDGKTVRIAPDGDIDLPVVGHVHAAGLATPDLQSKFVEVLKGIYVNPHASINMTLFRSQPVYVYGAVSSNGEYQLEGKKTLSQILSKAGGPRSDAGYRVIIQRSRENGAIPLLSNKLDPSGSFFIAEVKLRDLLYATNPGEDIELVAGDKITVPPGELVYVSGAINKPGGYLLGDEATIPVSRLIALAEGTKRTAKLKDAVILRQSPGGKLEEIPINLADSKNPKVKSAELQPKDILVIDDSAVKGTIRSTAGSILQTITGMAIYRIP